MKSCILFIFAVAVLALAHARSGDRMKEIAKKCAEKGAIKPPALCKHVELNLQTENGDINKVALKESIENIPGIPEAVVTETMAKCGERNGDSAGEAAIAMETCLKEHLHAHLPASHVHH